MAVGVWTRARSVLPMPRTAIVCAFAFALLLTVRSVMERLDPSRQHAWQYPVLIALTLWTSSAAWHAILVARLFARKRLRRQELLALTPHLILVLGLAAYTWGGLGSPAERFAVSAAGADVHGESYRVLGVDSSIGREWATRPVTVSLETTSPRGTKRLRVRYGRTWTSASGQYQLALSRHATVTTGVTLRHGDSRIVVRPGQPVHTKQTTVALRHLHDPRITPDAGLLEAEVTLGPKRASVPFDPEWMGETAFVGLEESLSAQLLVRRRPSTAATWIAALSFVAMTVLGWLLRPRALPRFD